MRPTQFDGESFLASVWTSMMAWEMEHLVRLVRYQQGLGLGLEASMGSVPLPSPFAELWPSPASVVVASSFVPFAITLEQSWCFLSS